MMSFSIITQSNATLSKTILNIMTPSVRAKSIAKLFIMILIYNNTHQIYTQHENNQYKSIQHY
jgi:hypothetical protein